MKVLSFLPALTLAAGLSTAAFAQSPAPDSLAKAAPIDITSRQYAPVVDPILHPSLVKSKRRTAANCQAGAPFGTTPGKGGFELGGGGSINFGSGATVGNITVNAGYFASPNLEVGADVSLLFVSGGGTDGIVGPYARYHFNTGNRNVPYLDAGVLFAIGNGFAGTDAVVSVGGGMDFFFREHQAVFVEVRGLIPTGGGDALGQVNFGLRSYFPR